MLAVASFVSMATDIVAKVIKHIHFKLFPSTLGY